MRINKIEILIKCKGCKSEFYVKRTGEIPEDATSMNCNWCPACEDDADDYYHETYNYDDKEDPDPNQLRLL